MSKPDVLTVNGADHEQVTTKQDLNTHIDQLLRKYLEKLDQYMVARKQLSSDFAEGFMFLTQTNLSSSYGKRCGQDSYDERMKALITVNIEAEQGETKFQFCRKLPNYSAPEHEKKDNPTNGNTAGASDTPRSNETPLVCEENENLSNEKHPDQSQSQDTDPPPINDEKPKAEPSSNTDGLVIRDPITWFGILAPPSLRAAQTSFWSAVRDPILVLTELDSELSRIEVEVRRTRKRLSKLK